MLPLPSCETLCLFYFASEVLLQARLRQRDGCEGAAGHARRYEGGSVLCKEGRNKNLQSV